MRLLLSTKYPGNKHSFVFVSPLHPDTNGNINILQWANVTDKLNQETLSEMPGMEHMNHVER